MALSKFYSRGIRTGEKEISIIPEIWLTARRALARLAAMEHAHAARCLEKLGNPTRLEIFRLLVRSGPAGATVGEIQDRLRIPGSTLSHHISHLVNAGLVNQAREGRVLRCTPNYALMSQVMEFLTAECCTGVGLAAGAEKAG